MTKLLRTVLYECHVGLGAQLVEFGGWEMPIQYAGGIVKEHIATRESAGIFDVSHMGRLFISGADCVAFLQHVLSNDCEGLSVGQSQYTMIQNAAGGVIDDAYLYRFVEDVYLLVVNASNREKDVAYLRGHLQNFPGTVLNDRSREVAMISLQGPKSKEILDGLLSDGHLPHPVRNSLSVVHIGEAEVCVGQTGYTGEPLGFELFLENRYACPLWDLLIEKGAVPIGLGARDTLRLEASLPLYGHELGQDRHGVEIPLFTSKLSRFAVSFVQRKGAFIGREALQKQGEARKRILAHDYSAMEALPRMVMSLALTGKGVAREGYKVFCGDKVVGYVTSGTSVPYLESQTENPDSHGAREVKRRSIALALIDSDLREGALLEIEIRKKRCAAVVVPRHMDSGVAPSVRILRSS